MRLPGASPGRARCTSTSRFETRSARSSAPTSTATSPPALEGRGERPLVAVASEPPLAADALLEEIAERIAGSPKGLIVCGRQLDPQLALPVAALAAGAGYPILAEPVSQLRLGSHDRDLVVWPYDWIAGIDRNAGPRQGTFALVTLQRCLIHACLSVPGPVPR